MKRYGYIADWWSENGPPVYISVAAYLGLIKGRNKTSGEPEEEGDLGDLLNMAGPGGIIN